MYCNRLDLGNARIMPRNLLGNCSKLVMVVLMCLRCVHGCLYSLTVQLARVGKATWIVTSCVP